MSQRYAFFAALLAAAAAAVLALQGRLSDSIVVAAGWSHEVVADGLANVDSIVIGADNILYATVERESGQIVRLLLGGAAYVIYTDLDAADGLILHDDQLFVTEKIESGRVLAVTVADLSVIEIIRMTRPEGLAVLPDGTFVVSEDVDPGRIVSISPDGTVGTLAQGLRRPEGLAVDAQGVLHAAETLTGRVLRFGADGMETVLEGLTSPGQIAFAADGSLWITEDEAAGRLLRWHDARLEVIAEGLAHPQGIDIDGKDRVYVAEQGTGRIVRFNQK